MNKPRNTTEYFKQWQLVKLSDSARAQIVDNLRTHARYHGVRVGADDRSSKHVPTRTSVVTLFTNPYNHSFMIPALIMLTLLVGGGTSYAATDALPGELLYPIKVDVNERVVSAFTFSDESEAALQTHLAEKRLQEAETLAAAGKLDTETSAELGARFVAHYHKVEEHNARAEEDGAHETAATTRTNLNAALHAHTKTLAHLATTLAKDTEVRDETDDQDNNASSTANNAVNANIRAQERANEHSAVRKTVAELEAIIQMEQTLDTGPADDDADDMDDDDEFDDMDDDEDEHEEEDDDDEHGFRLKSDTTFSSGEHEDEDDEHEDEDDEVKVRTSLRGNLDL